MTDGTSDVSGWRSLISVKLKPCHYDDVVPGVYQVWWELPDGEQLKDELR